MNFNDAEVQSVIKIMAKTTGKTFLFNKKDLKGKKVTLMSDQKFSTREAYKIFESILTINGLSTIENGNITRIISSKVAKVTPTPLFSRRLKNGGSLVTRIFPIRNVSIKRLRSTLAPIISKNSILTQSEEANLLIVRDTKENTDNLAKIIYLIDRRQSNFKIKIYHLKNANASKLAGVISKLLTGTGLNVKGGKKAILTADTRTNTLIIVYPNSRGIAMVEDIIENMDQLETETSLELYPLEFANATVMADLLRKMFPSPKGSTARIKVFAEKRRNMLVVLYPGREEVKLVENIIKDMDKQESSVSLELYPLEFADATVMAGLLTKIFPTPKGGASHIKIFAEKRTNKLVLIGHPKTINKIKDIIVKLDTEIEQEYQKSRNNIHVYPLKNANAKIVAEVLQKVAQTMTKTSSGKGKNIGKPNSITIIPDVPSNSLVIFAEHSTFLVVESVIKRLDRIRPQVFIQALIMEVKLDKSLQLGVQWQAGKLVNQGRSTAGFATIAGVGGTGGPKGVGAAINEGSGSVMGIIGNPITFGGEKYTSFNAFVKATQTDQEIDILSSPQILTLNNEEAEIKVGEIIPTVASTKVDTKGNTTTGIEYKEVGISLKITPQINSDDSIELKIDETSSNVIEGSVGAFDQGAITTLNRSLKTKIVVNDGETVVLGGLISDKITQVENKTPCLGDIPILGWFFKVKQTKTNKTNLMIFLSPKVVRTKEDLVKLTKITTKKLKRARLNKFRIDVSKEYQMPDMLKEGRGSEEDAEEENEQKQEVQKQKIEEENTQEPAAQEQKIEEENTEEPAAQEQKIEGENTQEPAAQEQKIEEENTEEPAVQEQKIEEEKQKNQQGEYTRTSSSGAEDRRGKYRRTSSSGAEDRRGKYRRTSSSGAEDRRGKYTRKPKGSGRGDS